MGLICQSSFYGANLKNANLSNLNSGITILFEYYGGVAYPLLELNGENYFEAGYFVGANLELFHLEGLNFRGANFSGTNLRDLDLSELNFTNANFSNADLSYTNLIGSDLSGADLRNASLSGINIRKIKHDKDTKFDQTK